MDLSSRNPTPLKVMALSSQGQTLVIGLTAVALQGQTLVIGLTAVALHDRKLVRSLTAVALHDRKLVLVRGLMAAALVVAASLTS
jgi:hypothetical protein